MSPEYGRFIGFSIFLKVAERDLNEPPHVHVRRHGDTAGRSSKFWVTPEGVNAANNKAKFNKRDMLRIEAYLNLNKSEIIVWYMQVTGRI